MYIFILYVCIHTYCTMFVHSYLEMIPRLKGKKSWKQICPTLGHIPKIIQIAFELANWIIGSCFSCWGKPPKAMAFWDFFESPKPWGSLRDASKHHICSSAEGTIRHGGRHVAPETPVFPEFILPQKLHFYKAQLSYLSSWVTKCRFFMILHHCHGNYWLFSCMDANGLNGWILWFFTVFFQHLQSSPNGGWTSPIFKKKRRGGKKTKPPWYFPISSWCAHFFFRLWSLQIESQHLKQPLGQDLKFAVPL